MVYVSVFVIQNLKKNKTKLGEKEIKSKIIYFKQYLRNTLNSLFSQLRFIVVHVTKSKFRHLRLKKKTELLNCV